MFNSKYQIVCAPMNGVSDLKLALACADAGIVPSFVPAVYKEFSDFLRDFREFKSKTSTDVIVAIMASIVIDDRLMRLYPTLGITHIEILDLNIDLTEENINKFNKIRSMGIKIMLKGLIHQDFNNTWQFIDAVTVKSPEGAGRSDAGVDIIHEIKEIKKRYPALKIVASGGVKDRTDIDRLLAAGADAVSIGTMFALTKESSMPESTKLKLISKSSSDITRLNRGASQRAIVFTETAGVDDYNNTNGLVNGLQTASQGHVFVGNAISSIDSIVSVADVVKKLTA